MNRRGFTLLEVLVGLLLLGLFVTLIQGIYSGTRRNREAARDATEAVHGASAALNLLCDEFAMAFHTLPWIERTAFRLDSDSETKSTVEFTTRAPRVESLRSGGDVRVRYELEPMDDARDRYVLKRVESPDPFGDTARNSTSYEMLSRVTRFKVTCYDGAQWTESWRLDDPAAPELPLAVAVELGWEEGGGERLVTASTVVYGAEGRNADASGGTSSGGSASTGGETKK